MTDTCNITVAVEDPLTNTNLTVFYDQMKGTYNIYHYSTYVTDTIKLIISILSIVADICIITVIIKDPKLRTNTNIYILHYSIWHIVFVTFFPLFYIFMDLLALVDFFPMIIYSRLWQIHRLSLSLIFLLGLCLALHWFVNIPSLHFVKCSTLFNTYGIYLPYLLISLKFAFEYFVKITSPLHVIYIFIALILLVFNFMDYRRKKDESNYKNYGLISSNIIIFFWLPVFVYDELISWSYGSATLHSIFLLTLFLPEWVSYSTSIALLIVLTKMDVNVKMMMFKMFCRRNKCCKDDVETLEEDEGDDDSNSVVTGNNIVYI
ncbi:uncharacterized protein LOC126892543 [Diabrotica virgifera virgifera]|uniref:G-protein coupled receptors family 1 profile domain-containing protein n=1 Tax=Diabrotica virgifera virgifera TaxID=50390 RepID=A0ABM5L6J5_DIAVI|nr:uncharacterized protein LOC126892543 [Diabrotica virgifera virgifera]